MTIEWAHADGCYINGVLVQAPLVYSGPYTISCRFECFTLSFTPEGERHACGSFPTLREAQTAAERHASGELKATKVWPPDGDGGWPMNAEQREARKIKAAKSKHARQRELELDIEDVAKAGA